MRLYPHRYDLRWRQSLYCADPTRHTLPLCCLQARTQEARLQEMLALRQRHADKVAEQIGRVVSDVKQVRCQGAREWVGMSGTK